MDPVVLLGPQDGAEKDGELRTVFPYPVYAAFEILMKHSALRRNPPCPDNPVEIYIGERVESSQPYVFDKDHLTVASHYFEAILSPRFIEGRHGEIHFPEDNERAWAIFAYFLSQGCIERSNASANDRMIGDYFTGLCEAYIIADKYGMTKFDEAVLRTFVDGVYSHVIPVDIMIQLLSLVPAGTELRKLLLQEIVLGAEDQKFYEWREFEGLQEIEGFFPEVIASVVQFKNDPVEFRTRRYGGLPLRIYHR